MVFVPACVGVETKMDVGIRVMIVGEQTHVAGVLF